MPAPLAGIRMIDLTELLPGPFATQIFADLGAEVIKVERPPHGDNIRRLMPATFHAVNRGKASVLLDLKQPADQARLHELVRTADVFLEGFRPGVVARLGCDYPTLANINPGLIYASISGFGQTGPERDTPGHDLNYLAMAGIIAVAGLADGPPAHAFGISVADIAGSMFAVTSVLAAIIQRQTSGVGQFLDVSITDSAAAFMGTRLPVLLEMADPRQFLRRPGYGVFECRDGGQLVLAAIEDHFWRRMAEAIGLPDLLAPEYATMVARMKHNTALDTRLRTRFRDKPLAEWLALLKGADVPANVVVQPKDLIRHPHVVARNLIGEDAGRQFVRFPVPMTDLPSGDAPSPEVGADTKRLTGRTG